MTLTTVVGSSGSGKTTFLNDVRKRHKCTYLRQYHAIRPYIPVTKIPNYDPTLLPFWEIYVKEGAADKIQVGGTMAGKFTAGLSGGQRKLLLFELLYQRTTHSRTRNSSTAPSTGSGSSTSSSDDGSNDTAADHSSLLLVLDEPFAGVTDDFVPFILQRLNEMRKFHNILLVTNDHVRALTDMADNTITVSAVDRTRVQVQGEYHDIESSPNKPVFYDREKAIMALSVGDEYQYAAVTREDLTFFWYTEVFGNGGIIAILVSIFFTFACFTMTFWNSQDYSASLVLIAGGSISFFVLSPYMLSLVDWRNYISEEAEALLHSSKGMNKFLKTMLTLSLMLLISVIQYGVFQLIIENLKGWDFWVAMFFDNASVQFPFICFGIYTQLPHQYVEILSGMPFLFMIFFSTTYSPGAGLPVIKELRYLFTRFYLFCMTPYVDGMMEECPADRGANLMLLVGTGCLCVVLFTCFMTAVHCSRQHQRKKRAKSIKALRGDKEYMLLQAQLYGDKLPQHAVGLTRTVTQETELTDSEMTDAQSSYFIDSPTRTEVRRSLFSMDTSVHFGEI